MRIPRIALALLSAATTSMALAQEIVRTEYFVDTDPGYGQAKVIAAAKGDAGDYILSLEGVNAGAHILYIRSQDSEGRWSATASRPLYVQPYQGFWVLEYFYDAADPGPGKASVLPRPDSSVSNLLCSLPTSGLALGTHVLNVRGMRQDGMWSDLVSRPFLVVEHPAEPGNLEYFIDSDPGYGMGQSAAVTTGTSQVAIDLGNVAPGAHILYLRSRDEQGRWSATVSHPLYVLPLVDIVQLEYFYDAADPGQGLGIQVELPADKLSEFAFEADASQLTEGPHLLNVRARDSKGRWTLLSSESFSVVKSQTGINEVVADFAFSIEASNGQCRLTTNAGNIRNNCRVEVVDAAGQVLALANWPVATSNLLLTAATHKGAVLIVRILDVKDGRQLVRRLLMK